MIACQRERSPRSMLNGGFGVDLARYALPLRTAGIGASRPLRRIPAIVSFLNPQPALSLVGGNRSSCPEGDLCSGPEIYRRGG
jgi:hypothetical protein